LWLRRLGQLRLPDFLGVRVLAISHERDAGPGVFADAIRATGARLDVWHRAETDDLPGARDAYGAVITFGGAMHVDQAEAHPWISDEIAFLAELLASGMPVLGVCLGAQLLARAAGGEVRRAREPEIGWRDVRLTAAGAADPLLAGLTPGFEAYEWHSYECLPPENATVLATSDACVQAFRIGESAWGIQFHAEVTAADALGWIRDYATTDPDAVRLGVDEDALRSQTRERIAGWNELGRSLCSRFLAAAEVLPATAAH
jgi:GMP synthase-like glutamine amidotransferase